MSACLHVLASIFGVSSPHVTSSALYFCCAGGNTGLGFETAKALGMAGYQDIVLACRNTEKGEAAVKALSEVSPAGVSFKNELLCLDDLSSVRDFVKRMQVGVVCGALLNCMMVLATEMQ